MHVNRKTRVGRYGMQNVIVNRKIRVGQDKGQVD